MKRASLVKFVQSSEPFDASSFHDAEQKAYHPLLPILSNWSLHLDIPVYVVQSEVVELRTGVHSGRVNTAPAESAFAVKGDLVVKPGSEFLHYASLYREALIIIATALPIVFCVCSKSLKVLSLNHFKTHSEYANVPEYLLFHCDWQSLPIVLL
jgi:hypothetical protein